MFIVLHVEIVYLPNYLFLFTNAVNMTLHYTNSKYYNILLFKQRKTDALIKMYIL